MFLNGILLTGLLASTGCLQLEQVFLLRKDGSGTLEVKYTIPNETSERVQAMLKLTREMSVAARQPVQPMHGDAFTRMLFTPQETDISETIKSYNEYGISLERIKVENRNAAYDVEFKVRFEDIAEVAKADFFEHYGLSIAKVANGNFLMYTRPVTDEPLDRAWDANNTDVLSRLTPFLNGFDFKVEFHAPGKILRTNGDQKSAYAALWHFDFVQDPNAVAELQRSRMTVLFDGIGIDNLQELSQPKAPDEAEEATDEDATEEGEPEEAG
jgi:hypothetical protein